MKLQRLYEVIVEEGIKTDPRGNAVVKGLLAEEKKKYEKLNTKEKEIFDRDRLFNPYADSRILFGNPSMDIKSAVVGIDLEVGEMVLIDRLRERGEKISCAISHHPAGNALANFYEVMSLHTEFFSKQGVPVALAESLTKERMGEVGRSVSSANHMQIVDAARLLNIPLLCAHTPADNHVALFLQKLCDAKKPKRLKDVLDILNDLDEYKQAARVNAAPFILNGNPESYAGKILVDMTGGTQPSKEIFARLLQQGISTIIGMHYSEAHFKKAKEERLNIIIAGHIASDNLGLNLLLDKVLKKEKIAIIEASGFRRVKRK